MTEIITHPLAQGRPPTWAVEWGEDRRGIFASFAVGEVLHRMRWIPPGRFWMGSPESEEGRYYHEPRHERTLGEFWLGETACTQELWEAVMGENPSRFQNPQRPVENVSWRDARSFCDRLNESMPELEVRLPSEVEWEYACRAGTETAFSFGATVSPEQVNYNGNYPLGETPKGLDRKETVPVRTLPPNPWGLFEMHGNVFELCEDAWREDPRNKGDDNDPGSPRVVRGGSWDSFAWLCRSAFRLRVHPVDRYGFLGFRLFRGR